MKNEAGAQNYWLGIKLIGRKSNPDAIGVLTYHSGNGKRSRMKDGGSSYLSPYDPRMVQGLGGRRKIDSLEVIWPLPGGRSRQFIDLPVHQYILVTEGETKWS